MANCKKWPNADCDQVQSVTKCRVWSNAECEQISVAQLLIGYPILPYFQKVTWQNSGFNLIVDN